MLEKCQIDDEITSTSSIGAASGAIEAVWRRDDCCLRFRVLKFPQIRVIVNRRRRLQTPDSVWLSTIEELNSSSIGESIWRMEPGVSEG